MVKEGPASLDYEFPLHEYKDSCSIFIRGKKIKRCHVIAYVANKKGGAHLDHSRRKDEEAYRLLDAAEASGWRFGGKGGKSL
jgi:hypothetical protein